MNIKIEKTTEYDLSGYFTENRYYVIDHNQPDHCNCVINMQFEGEFRDMSESDKKQILKKILGEI